MNFQISTCVLCWQHKNLRSWILNRTGIMKSWGNFVIKKKDQNQSCKSKECPLFTSLLHHWVLFDLIYETTGFQTIPSKQPLQQAPSHKKNKTWRASPQLTSYILVSMQSVSCASKTLLISQGSHNCHNILTIGFKRDAFQKAEIVDHMTWTTWQGSGNKTQIKSKNKNNSNGFRSSKCSSDYFRDGRNAELAES